LVVIYLPPFGVIFANYNEIVLFEGIDDMRLAIAAAPCKVVSDRDCME